MRCLCLLTVAVLFVGCAHRLDSRPNAVQAGSATIAAGQPWAQAKAVATRAGYELHDASQLAMDPTPDGFYIDMPGRRGLLVYRDPRRDVVESMEWVENWPGPKKPRVHHDVQAFQVPPADPAARKPNAATDRSRIERFGQPEDSPHGAGR
jgi:hypothetical protein